MCSVGISLAVEEALLAEFLGEDGHSTVLRADEGADLDGALVSLTDAATLEDAGYEATGEGVAGADGVGNLNHGGGHEAYLAGSIDVGAVGAAGEDEHLEVPLGEEHPALVFAGDALQTVDLGDELEFLVVDLEDVALTEVLLDDLLAVEVLTDVDVEDLEAGHAAGGAADGAGHLGHRSKELADGLAANFAALSE